MDPVKSGSGSHSQVEGQTELAPDRVKKLGEKTPSSGPKKSSVPVSIPIAMIPNKDLLNGLKKDSQVLGKHKLPFAPPPKRETNRVQPYVPPQPKPVAVEHKAVQTDHLKPSEINLIGFIRDKQMSSFKAMSIINAYQLNAKLAEQVKPSAPAPALLPFVPLAQRPTAQVPATLPPAVQTQAALQTVAQPPTAQIRIKFPPAVQTQALRPPVALPTVALPPATQMAWPTVPQPPTAQIRVNFPPAAQNHASRPPVALPTVALPPAAQTVLPTEPQPPRAQIQVEFPPAVQTQAAKSSVALPPAALPPAAQPPAARPPATLPPATQPPPAPPSTESQNNKNTNHGLVDKLEELSNFNKKQLIKIFNFGLSAGKLYERKQKLASAQASAQETASVPAPAAPQNKAAEETNLTGEISKQVKRDVMNTLKDLLIVGALQPETTSPDMIEEQTEQTEEGPLAPPLKKIRIKSWCHPTTPICTEPPMQRAWPSTVSALLPTFNHSSANQGNYVTAMPYVTPQNVMPQNDQVAGAMKPGPKPNNVQSPPVEAQQPSYGSQAHRRQIVSTEYQAILDEEFQRAHELEKFRRLQEAQKAREYQMSVQQQRNYPNTHWSDYQNKN